MCRSWCYIRQRSVSWFMWNHIFLFINHHFLLRLDKSEYIVSFTVGHQILSLDEPLKTCFAPDEIVYSCHKLMFYAYFINLFLLSNTWPLADWYSFYEHQKTLQLLNGHCNVFIFRQVNWVPITFCTTFILDVKILRDEKSKINLDMYLY